MKLHVHLQFFVFSLFRNCPAASKFLIVADAEVPSAEFGP